MAPPAKPVNVLVLSYPDIRELILATAASVAMEMTTTAAKMSADRGRFQQAAELCLSHASDCIKISPIDSAYRQLKDRLERDYFDRYCEAVFRGPEHVDAITLWLARTHRRSIESLRDFVRRVQREHPNWTAWASDWLFRLSVLKAGATIVVEGTAVVALFVLSAPVAAEFAGIAFAYSLTGALVDKDIVGSANVIAVQILGAVREVAKEVASKSADALAAKLIGGTLAQFEASLAVITALRQRLGTSIWESALGKGIINPIDCSHAIDAGKVMADRSRSLKVLKIGTSLLPIVFTAADIVSDVVDAYKAHSD